MAVLSFSDLLEKAGINPKDVKLIRHAYSDKNFNECAKRGLILEYTQHQKRDFSKGYKYWAVFVSSEGTLAKFHSIYEVGEQIQDTPDRICSNLPESEAKKYNGENSIFELKKIDILEPYENKLIIEWIGARAWHQKGSNEKPIVWLIPDEKKVFMGYEDTIIKYDDLKEIINNPVVYEAWHTALKSVHAIYLIVDTETGKQYIGSAYGKDGLLGRWSCYISSFHGNNKLMKEVICNCPDRYHAFQFSILQILPKTMTDEEIIAIESRWKKKLLTIQFGMNDN